MSVMEDILANQQQIAKAIEQVLTNFNKDGAERKTPEYLLRRIDILDNYWLEFNNNHARLSEFGMETHSYVTSNEFERVRERYEAIRAHFQGHQPTAADRPKTPVLKPPTFKGNSSESYKPSPSSRGTASKTDEMLKKQSSNFKAFQRTTANINLASVSEKWEFDDILRTLQARWAAIDALHWDLDSELEGSNKQYEEAFSNYEKEYNDIKKAINKKMWSVAHREKATPQMEIPTFHGNYNSWVSFKDLFTETIHNNPSISCAQKMQYLKTKIKGEAERLIQHLHVSSENYSTCWDILNQRYNNKKLIFTSHINILMGLPVTQQQSLNHIKRLHDTTLECLNAIKNLGIDISTWDPLIVHILSQKLDIESYTDYIESVKQPRELPILKEFLIFLETKFTTLESARRKQDNTSQKYQVIPKLQTNNYPINSSNQKYVYNKNSFSTSTRMTSKYANSKSIATARYRCLLCSSNDHGIYYCRKFLDMSPFIKRKTVTKLNLCPNCLFNHQGKACLSERRCRECNKEHNSLLHEAFTQSRQTTAHTEIEVAGAGEGSSANTSAAKIVKSSSHVYLPNDPIEVLLPTAIIKVQGSDGSYHTMRALLDQGSQTSLITEHAAQLLRLPRKRCKGIISGVGDKESNCKGIISIECASAISDFTFKTDVLIMKSLIKNLPSCTFAKPEWSYLDHIKLADPEFYLCRPVDILLGADVYSIVLLDNICRVNSTLPIAQQTQLGWILSGNVKTFQCNVVLHDMNDIQQFWELEDISESSDISSEDQQCIEYYQATTKRREDGRYEVRLPLRPNYQERLGTSKHKAIAQFRSLEQKLCKQTDIKEQYTLFINEYLSLGHMTPAVDDSNLKLTCYLPHHYVTRLDSTTTKLRVVFNASSKTTSGCSLNDVMYSGPNLQQDLQSLIIKWRQYRFAFTADLEKMFRQIWLNPEDQQLHKIVWRDHESKKLQFYQLATVTYGTKAAPFLAMFTLKQLARDEGAKYQNSSAPRVLEECFFMDDLIHGTHSIESAQQLQKDMIHLLKSGGFNLRKWKSNSPELLKNISVNETEHTNFDFKQGESTKALGLRWNPSLDYFKFEPKMDMVTSTARPTKRELLSDISKLYDPLGWLSPITTKLKILFQNTWKTNIKWDEPVTKEVYDEWIKVKADIMLISDYQVPRWLGTEENDFIELHGFCDASTKAYACVVYCKVNKNGTPSIKLLAGKAKLVPLVKTTTLPRLELCGAVLLAKLMAKIKGCLNNFNIKTYGWTDSMAVLGWLHGDTDRWKPFVANRVKQVTTIMPAGCWNYVKSKDNPADCASRGLTASLLKEHNLWWQGPNWLPSYKPERVETISSYSTDQEVRKLKVAVVTKPGSNNDIVNKLIEQCSSLSKAVRILGWVLRFIHRSNKQDYLTVKELHYARTLIIKRVQQERYSDEINNLKTNKIVNSNSSIYDLNPLIDESGVLRVGGRLRHANLDPETKHPAIIPSNTRLADILIDEAHELSYHGGARLTTAFMRRKYWLIGGIRAAKKRLRLCVKCRKHTSNQHYQIMGDLPSARSNPSRTFYQTGVDYTGHVLIKANKGRGIKTTKGYVAVFVCMTTKAVHLELVSDLTASAFLAALRRMAARRGVPGHMYSDQGTNFIGANNILQQEHQELQNMFNQDFMSEIASMGIEWHFNAPAWPSAGGLWEAAVKSLKHHLKRVIGEQKLTYEEYSTLLSQLEGCLNSRPLCPMTEDPNDLDIITPSHFLGSGPSLNIYETENDLRTRWHLTQKIFKDIWDRWRNEYLTQIAARSKWRKPQRNIKENDVVIIRDENLPPGKWALGRVVELHPGSDGYVRVVTLKTKNGFMKRPVVKLSILPVSIDQDTKEETTSSSSREQEKDETKTNSVSRKKKTYCFTSLAASLLLFFISIIPTVQSSYNITPLQNRSLYFDSITNMHLIQDDWRLVVYYDTQPYKQGNVALKKYIQYLDGICMNIKEQSLCTGIMLQLRHEFDELQYNNNILLNRKYDTRVRRGLINGIGSIANSLFGVLDESFAEKYEKDISLIKDNQKHLSLLWKNQTSIIEAEFNLLKRTEDIMDKHHKSIIQKINAWQNTVYQVKKDIQDITLSNEFFSTTIMTNNILFSLRNVQQTLLDTVTNVYNGKFNFHLITPDQLRQELNVIAGQLPKDLSLPVDNFDLSQVYNLLQVRARITGNYIIFEVKIPLITRDMYEILKLIPVPQLSDSLRETIIKPIAEYVAINLRKDAFVPLSEHILDSCIQRDPKIVLCHLRNPIYHLKNDQSLCETIPHLDTCKTITSLCFNKWTELNKLNTYFYSCCEQCQLKLLCDDQVTAVQMTHSGLFTASQGCIIKTADFFIQSHKQGGNTLNIRSEIQAPEISPINHYINISLPKTFIPKNESDNLENNLQLQKIKEQLDMIKDSDPLAERVSYHDVHHYAAIYVLFAVVGAGAAVIVWRRGCGRRRPTSAPAAVAVPAGAAAAAEQGVPLAAALSSVSVESSECIRCSESDIPKLSARVLNQNKSTSPVLRAAITIPNSGVRIA